MVSGPGAGGGRQRWVRRRDRYNAGPAPGGGCTEIDRPQRQASTQSRPGERTRGQSDVVGVVLLFGMVIVGTALLFVTGSVLLESLQGEADAERTELEFESATDQLSQAAESGRSRRIPGTGADRSIAENTTTFTFRRINATDAPTAASPATWQCDEQYRQSLNALEYDLGNRNETYVFEGGGEWHVSDGYPSVRSPPQFDVGHGNGNTVRIDLVDIDPDSAVSGGNLVAEPNTDSAVDESALRSAARCQHADPDDEIGGDLLIEIESQYIRAWDSYLNQSGGIADGTGGVHYFGPADTGDDILLVVENRFEPVFTIRDRGLTDQDVDPISGNTVGSDVTDLGVNATLIHADGAPTDATATLRLRNDTGVVADRTLESAAPIEMGDSIRTDNASAWHGDPTFDLGGSDPDLRRGERYEYNIEVTPGNATLAENGTFLVLEDGVRFSIEGTDVTDRGNRSVVGATIQNLGDENGTENVHVEFTSNGSVVANRTVQLRLNSTAAKEIRWGINETRWPGGEYGYEVSTDNDTADGDVEVADGVAAVVIEDDLGVVDADLINGTEGQVVADDGSMTVATAVTNRYPGEQTQNVTLELQANNTTVGRSNASITIGANETERVELTAALDGLSPGKIYEYTVSTEDDALDTPGSFLLLEEPPSLAVEITGTNDPVQPRDPLTVDVEVTNEGEPGEEFVWLDGFDNAVAAVEAVDLDRGETTTVTLEWGRMAVPEDGSSITVESASDNDTADIAVEPLLEITDVSAPSPIDQGDQITVQATLDSLGGSTNQRIELVDPEGAVAASRNTGTVHDSKTVDLNHNTDGDVTTGWWTVRTEDDEREVLIVVERDGPDCGAVGYGGSGTSDEPYRVSTVDELQCIDEYDLDAHYALVDDIAAHGTEYWNGGAGFEPIAEQTRGGAEFSGGFDGRGYRIDGLTIDRPDEPFVGLFAVTAPFDDGNAAPVGEGTAVRNVRVENVSVHGQQVTGGVIGGAGGPVENVRVSGTVEAEHQEVGGIVGHSHNADLDNRLVSVATVRGGVPAAAVDGVSHPWGADNMGIGGIVGGTGYNTRVSTAYSRADVEGPGVVGGIVGWTSDFASHSDQMYWANGTITITASQAEIDDWQSRMGRNDYDQPNTGGAMFGRGDDTGDTFADSVYVDETDHPHAFGEHVIDDEIDVTQRTTTRMQGLNVTEDGHMSNLDYEDEGGPWVAIPGEYPRFAWELEAEGVFEVDITDIENVTVGEAATVDVTVTSRYQSREESNVTQTITLTDPAGRTVDSQQVTLPSTLGENEQTSIDLVWQTAAGDQGIGSLTARSKEREDSAVVEIEDAEHGPGDSNGPAPRGELNDTISEGDLADLGPGTSGGGGDMDLGISIGVDVVEID